MRALFLFDYSTVSAQPWAAAGYECYCFDRQHPIGENRSGNIIKVGIDIKYLILPKWEDVAFVAAFPPCTHLAVSGARWFKGKGLRLLSESIELFAKSAEICESFDAPYMIENPVSSISTYWRKPDHTFNPYDYTGYCVDDNYTKKTCLWVGNGFKMPNPHRDPNCSQPDNRIHICANTSDRSNIRSKTPYGFSLAVYKNNSGIIFPREPVSYYQPTLFE